MSDGGAGGAVGTTGASGATGGGGAIGGSGTDSGTAGASGGGGNHAGDSGTAGASGSGGNDAGDSGTAGASGGGGNHAGDSGTAGASGGGGNDAGDSGTAGASGGGGNDAGDSGTAGASGSGGNAGADSGVSCASGRGECDGDLSVTCETDLNTSVTNCGVCDNVCSAANGTPGCNAGTCDIISCNSGYDDCDAQLSNGCETNLNTTTDCGVCDNVCSAANGTPGCNAGTCDIISCNSGYDDCDAQLSNGCETDLNTTADCGVCDNVCPTAEGGTSVCTAGVCSIVCNVSGTFALKLTAQVSWPSRPYVYASSGTNYFYSWSILQATHTGNSVTGVLTECGKDAPHFESSGFGVNEWYKIIYPNSLFDNSYLPSASITATLGSSSPGATYLLDTTALLMGATMADPINDPWPSSASGLTQANMDGGKPGVSAVYLDSPPDYYARTSASAFGYNRADTVYVAARVAFSLSGTLTSCTQSAGSATVTHVDTRIFGCNLSGSTSDCSGTEASFLDNNQVNYQAGTATYTLVKIAGAGTCADVRAELP